MNYKQQQEYLTRGRIAGVVCVVPLLAAGVACLEAFSNSATRIIVISALVLLTLAGSLYYTPDYLHLTVDERKRARWAVRVRWRIIGAVLVLGALSATGMRGYIEVFLAVLWLVAANLLAGAVVPNSWTAAFFWATDFALISGLLLFPPFDLLTGGMLLAAALHLAIATTETRLPAWSAFSILLGGAMVVLYAWRRGPLTSPVWSLVALLLIAGIATAWLVQRAQKKNAENIRVAMDELVNFTGYSADRIRELWATSNQQLARNWQTAAVSEDDPERLKEWYRENSELYLFAISAYNLEYKRIRSNLKVLKFARGSCLDYGAGNGELLLDLARQGNPATYYDVEGVTMNFARQRAGHQGLALEFIHTKDALSAVASKRRFDTVFAFDVLEHVPDLRGELDYLSSLLNEGGLFIFDVPAGSTKSHPMHLNHDLNVLTYMKNKGLQDERGVLLRLPFRKEEKYVFRRPGGTA